MGLTGGVVGIIPGVIGWHVTRLLWGKYRDYYSDGWPLPLSGWVKNVPLVGRVRLLGHPVAGQTAVHTSAIDSSKTAEETIKGSSGRMF